MEFSLLQPTLLIQFLANFAYPLLQIMQFQLKPVIQALYISLERCIFPPIFPVCHRVYLDSQHLLAAGQLPTTLCDPPPGTKDLIRHQQSHNTYTTLEIIDNHRKDFIPKRRQHEGPRRGWRAVRWGVAQVFPHEWAQTVRSHGAVAPPPCTPRSTHLHLPPRSWSSSIHCTALPLQGPARVCKELPGSARLDQGPVHTTQVRRWKLASWLNSYLWNI